MPKAIDPEIVGDEDDPDDRAAADRKRALAKLDLLIKKLEESTRTHKHLIRLLEEQRQNQGLSIPGRKTPFERVVDHAFEAFPPDVLRGMAEDFLHELVKNKRKRR